MRVSWDSERRAGTMEDADGTQGEVGEGSRVSQALRVVRITARTIGDGSMSVSCLMRWSWTRRRWRRLGEWCSHVVLGSHLKGRTTTDVHQSTRLRPWLRATRSMYSRVSLRIPWTRPLLRARRSCLRDRGRRGRRRTRGTTSTRAAQAARAGVEGQSSCTRADGDEG